MIRDYIKANKEAECDAYRQGYVAIRRQWMNGSCSVGVWLNQLSDEDIAKLEAECNKFGNSYDGEQFIKSVTNNYKFVVPQVV